jgi:hypothetical protein
MNINPDTPSSDPILLRENACIDFGGGAGVFEMDEGLEVPQTYDRPGDKGSAAIVAFGVLSADGHGEEKKIQFPPSTFGPAGCQ